MSCFLRIHSTAGSIRVNAVEVLASIAVKSKPRNAMNCAETWNQTEIWRIEKDFFTESPAKFIAAVSDLRHSASEAAARLVCKSVYSGAPCEVISHKEAKLKFAGKLEFPGQNLYSSTTHPFIVSATLSSAAPLLV